MAMAYLRTHDVPVKIARIFNTYGPRLRRGDGRAVPTFIEQALPDEPITVHGDGSQTRSLCYVDDLVEGIWRLLISDVVGMPVNLGNPEEVKVLDLARTIVLLAGSASEVIFTERPIDDPEVRCPDISRATSLLGWVPRIPLTEGLERTISWARKTWRHCPHPRTSRRVMHSAAFQLEGSDARHELPVAVPGCRRPSRPAGPTR